MARTFHRPCLLVGPLLGVALSPNFVACAPTCEPPEHAVGTRFEVTVIDAPQSPCALPTFSAGDTFQITVDEYVASNEPEQCSVPASHSPHGFGNDDVLECSPLDDGFLGVVCEMKHDDPNCRRTIHAQLTLDGEENSSGDELDRASYSLRETVSGSGCSTQRSCQDHYEVRLQSLAE